MSSEDSRPQRFRRKITPFIAREMLYDYAVDRLDADRRDAVAEFLKTDKESQSVLEGIKAAIESTARLSKTEINPDIIKQLKDAENAISLGRRYSSWREWPETLRWSLIAIFVSTSIAATIAIVPWSKFPILRGGGKKSDTIELAEIPKSNQQVAVQEQPDTEADAAPEGSGDEEFDDSDQPPVKLPPGVKLPQQASANAGHGALNPEKGDDHDEEDSPAAKIAAGAAAKPDAKTPTTAIAKTETSDPSSESAPTEAANAHKDSKAKGFVYRAFMTLSNLEEVAPKITEHIVEMGGVKAGEVELGWKRGTGRYYHFSMPEANEEKVLEKLRAYGPVRISKDPHPRVMPPGQVRFILWIESGD